MKLLLLALVLLSCGQKMNQEKPRYTKKNCGWDYYYYCYACDYHYENTVIVKCEGD